MLKKILKCWGLYIVTSWFLYGVSEGIKNLPKKWMEKKSVGKGNSQYKREFALKLAYDNFKEFVEGCKALDE